MKVVTFDLLDSPLDLDTCCHSFGDPPRFFSAALYEFVRLTDEKKEELGDFERLIFRSGSSYYLELAAGQLLLIRCPRPAS